MSGCEWCDQERCPSSETNKPKVIEIIQHTKDAIIRA